MKFKKIGYLISVLLIVTLCGILFWYFFSSHTTNTSPGSDTQSNSFNPFGRTPTTGSSGTSPQGTTTTSSDTGQAIKLPILRLLSDTPVGGYGASTTIAKNSTGTTTIRWIDRGRGNILEARSDTDVISTISNTILPRVHDSLWNKNLTAFIGSLFQDDGIQTEGIYSELKNRIDATGTSTTPQDSSSTPYELRGKNLPANLLAYASSPNKDRIFLLVNKSGTGVGYVSSFDGKNSVQLFTTPLNQVNVEWPTENILAITTKGSADQDGYLYFVDTKTGSWKKILGPLPGLSTRVSTDGKNVLYSTTGNSQNVVTGILNIAKNTQTDAIINTLADKCAWGNFYKEIVYCAVPSQSVKGVYPDDWYKGTLSTIDQIWQINASNGELHLISKIVDTSDRVIDAFNLGLDDKDNFLIFMNKNDLSLWSLDLVSNQ